MELALIFRFFRYPLGQFVPLGDEEKKFTPCLRVRDPASLVIAFTSISSAIFWVHFAALHHE